MRMPSNCFDNIVAPVGIALVYALSFTSVLYAIDDADGIISDFNKAMAYACISLAGIIAFSMTAWAIKTAPEPGHEPPAEIDQQPPPLWLQYCLMCIFPAILSLQIIYLQLTGQVLIPDFGVQILVWFELGLFIILVFSAAISITWIVNEYLGWQKQEEGDAIGLPEN